VTNGFAVRTELHSTENFASGEFVSRFASPPAAGI